MPENGRLDLIRRLKGEIKEDSLEGHVERVSQNYMRIFWSAKTQGIDECIILRWNLKDPLRREVDPFGSW